MSDYLQDELRLPVPETKGKKGLWIALAAIGIIFLIVVFIKAGISTKDPQKDINTATSETSESDKSVGDVMEEIMADSPGSTHGQSTEDDTLFIKEGITKNTELTTNEAETNTQLRGDNPSANNEER